MRRLLLATLGLAGVLAFSGARAADNSILTSVTTRSRFLSTEKAEATLTIINNSADVIFFYPCNVRFLVHTAAGWNERPRCMVITHIPVPDRIRPSAQEIVHIDLPQCEVHSDPCVQDVQIKYAIGTQNAQQQRTSGLLRYEFVPDPSETFEGVGGNRPVFIVPSIASDTIFPDTMVLEFQVRRSIARPPSTEAQDLESQLNTVVRGAGVTVTGDGYKADSNGWTIILYVQNASNQRNAITAALETVRTRFASRIAEISNYFVFDPMSDAYSITQATFPRAKKQAQELAYIAGVPDLEPGGGAASVHVFLEPNPYASFPDIMQSLPYGAPVKLSQTSATPTPITVVTENAFIGTRMARWNISGSVAKSAAQAFRPPESWYLPPLKPQLKIGADRPEIYMIGTASAGAALSQGLAPYFTAALNARFRIADLARLLGVRPGQTSLLALYPMSQDGDLRTLGMGTTFSGGDAVGWAKIKGDPQTPARPNNDSRIRAMVPIVVPEDATAITEMSQGTASFSARGSLSRCWATEPNLVKATIRQDWLQAQADADKSHRRIRKLLLVAVLPIECQSEHAYLTSLMIFRTFPR